MTFTCPGRYFLHTYLSCLWQYHKNTLGERQNKGAAITLNPQKESNRKSSLMIIAL